MGDKISFKLLPFGIVVREGQHGKYAGATACCVSTFGAIPGSAPMRSGRVHLPLHNIVPTVITVPPASHDTTADYQ